MHVAVNEALTRAERKKLLLLQGALYRVELSAAATNLKQGLGSNPVAGLIKPGLLRVLEMESLLPVLVNVLPSLLPKVLPLLAGKGTLSVWLRRAAIIAGVGGVVWAVLRRKDGPVEEAGQIEAQTQAQTATPGNPADHA